MTGVSAVLLQLIFLVSPGGVSTMAEYELHAEEIPMTEFGLDDTRHHKESSIRSVLINSAYCLLFMVGIAATLIFAVRDTAFEENTERASMSTSSETLSTDIDVINIVPVGPPFIPRSLESSTSQEAYGTVKQPSTTTMTSGTPESSLRTSNALTIEDTSTSNPTMMTTRSAMTTEDTSTSKRTIMTTRSTMTTEDTARTSARTTTVRTTTTPPSFPPVALVCTVTKGFTRATLEFPPDGLCTIVFFDSLEDRRLEQLSPPYDEDFTYFQETAQQHKRTMFGAGFNHKSSSALSEELRRPEANDHLENFWKSNVRHYGYINFPLYYVKKSAVTSALRNLKDVSARLENKKSPGSPIYTALRVFPGLRVFLLAALREVFVPDLLIVQASFDPDAFLSIDPCVMTPPLALALPAGIFTYYTMSSAIDEMLFFGKKFRSTVALALSLYGYSFKPAYPDLEETNPGNYSVIHQCSGSGVPETIVKVCGNFTFTQFIYDSTHHADFAFNKKIQTTFVYDSITALSVKLCETKTRLLDLPYVFAAYGLQYEDSKNTCGFGSFARLHYLRKLLEFLHNNYTSGQHAEACKRIR